MRLVRIASRFVYSSPQMGLLFHALRPKKEHRHTRVVAAPRYDATEWQRPFGKGSAAAGGEAKQ